MKKLFLTLTMLLFAFTGVMKAQTLYPQTLTVNDGTATSGYVPVYGYYGDAYNKCEMVYPAAELSAMVNAEITSMTFYATQASVSWGAASFQVFVAEVTNTTISSFAGPGTVVYEGSLSIAGNQMVVTFNEPYVYNGGNLLVGVYQIATGSYVTSTWNGQSATGASISGYSYSSLSSISATKRNFLPKTTFGFLGELPETNIVASVNPVELGVRPIGAWMKPFEFAITNQGAPTTVTGVDGSTNIAVEAEVPYALGYNGTMPIRVSTTGTPAAGTLNGQVLVSYSDRTFITIDATAEMYEPVDGDVWEKAITVTDMPFQGNAPAGIYKNYDLPTTTEGADVVYKVTFDEDVLFSAGTPGANAATALYAEGFDGVGGPDMDNDYVYTGPQATPAPVAQWLYYDNGVYDGSMGAGGTLYWGIRIPAADLPAAENCAITKVQIYDAGFTGGTSKVLIYEGGELVYQQPFSFNGASDWQVINLNTPVLIDNTKDLLIGAYNNGITYPAAGCQYQYGIGDNGDLVSFDGSSWSPLSGYGYYYTWMIRAWAETSDRATAMEITHFDGETSTGNFDQVAAAAPVVTKPVGGNNHSLAHKANHNTRDTQTLTVYGGSATNGYVPVYGFYADAYLKCQYVMAEDQLTDMVGSTINSMTFYLTESADEAWTGTFSVYMGEYSATTISDFSNADYQVVYNGTLDATGSTMVVTFTNPYEYNGGNLLIDFNQVLKSGNYPSAMFAGEAVTGASVQGYDYSSLSGITATQRNFVPKTTFTYEAAATPEPPTATYQIADMFVPAGTYYLAVASTTDNFQVDMAVADVPLPEQAEVIAPFDGETNVEAPYVAEWALGDYTTEMQVLFGTQYPPQVLIDWTSDLVSGVVLPELEPNQSYFMQVNARNAAGTTMGELIAFTTPIDGVEGFAVESAELYPGDAAVFTWEANRSFKGYNLYCDGVKVNETLITTNTYAVEGLEYNMLGYDFQVSAVYDAGESELSEAVTAYMTGNVSVSGHAYDKPDEDTDAMPIAFATVMFSGLDEYGVNQTFVVEADEEGAFAGEILAGTYTASVITEGYDSNIAVNATVNYDALTDEIDIYTHEYYYPLQQITATENEEENNVLVEWAWNPAEMIVDFETGDFSQADFTLPATYPWTITESNVYEGQYAMKSTCEGQGSASSIIEATVDVPYDGKMGFWVKVSSEANWDLFTFYIDGVAQGSAMSGNLNYQYKEYSVTEGTHTYKWEYTKDSSVNSNDDCVYVDAITMYRMVEPTPPPAPGDVVVKLTAPDIWGDGSGYQMLLDDTHSLYGTVIPESGALSTNCSGNEGIYDQFTYKIPTNADGNCSTSNIVINNTVEITIPSGIYDWCITNPTPGDRIWIAAANGNVGGRYDDYVFEGGHTYEFTISKYGSNDGVDVTITGGKAMNQPKMNFNNTDVKVADPVMLANRVETPIQTRGTRSFMSYNLYRRNNYDAASVANPELIAEGLTADVMQYVDNAWNTISFGEYQWGIQATYAGYAPVPERNREVYTYTFDSGLEGWTNIDADGDGNVWFNSSESQTYSCYSYATYGHNATGCFMVSQSYTDCTYDAYAANNFLVSPQKYPIDANSSITFWQDWANDDYPDFYEVMVSTAANPGASDFTSVWSVGSKSHGNGAKIRNINNRYGNWTEYTVSLAAYAGQEVWIAFRHQDIDNYELWLDDVTITAAGSAPVPPTPGETGDGLSEILWSNVIEKDMEATLTFNITLNNGQSPAGAIIEIVGDETYTEEVEDATTEIVVRKAPAYDITVTLPGYAPAPWTYSGAIEADQTFDINFEEQILPVEGLYVSPTGWATWDGVGGTPAPTPTPVPSDEVVVKLTVGDVWGDGSGYQMLLDDTHSLYGTVIPATGALSMNCSGNEGIYNQFSHKIPANADGNCSTSNIVLNSTVEITIPAGTYDWCITNPTPGDRIWIAAANGNVGGRQDDYVFEAGHTYEFTVSYYSGNDGVDVTITDSKGNAQPKGDEDAPIKYIVKLDGVIEGETNFIGFQHNVAGMEEGSEHTTAVRPVYISGDNGPWMEYTWTYTACDHFAGVTELAAAQQGTDVKLTWTMPDAPGPTPPPTPPTGDVVVKLTVGDVWGDGSGYQMLLDDTHSLYGTVIPATGALSTNCSGNEGIYNQFSHKIPENADGNCSTSNIVLNSTVEITIPAGTYDWCITNPTPGDRIWIAAANGNVGGRYDDYVFEAGHTYEFTVSMFGSNDGVNVTITGGKAMAQPKMMLANIDVRVADAAHTTQRGGTLGTAGVGFGAANNALTDDGNWYYYDNGVNDDAIGTNGGQFYWGIMLPAGYYDGNRLTKVAAYDYMAMSGTASIYQGGTTAPAGSALGTVNVTFTGAEDFVEFEFAEPVELDPEQNVWVVFYNASGATFPAAVCANTGDANGRWVSLDGSTWEDIASYDLDNTFMVRAYIESSGPAPVPVEEGILGAMIFMDDEPIAFVPGAPNEYVVAGAGSFDATYAVRVVYDGALDTTYYAMSCPVEVEYVAPPTSVEELSANTVIYPNPTHDNVTIEAKGMRRITVVSALGQVVYDAEIKADMTQMNLGQFKAGVYMVRIATENGTVVKRVTVVK